MLRALPVLFATALCAQAPPPATPMSPNLALVQRLVEAYNAHDAQAYAACFTPDIQFIRHPGIAQLQGKDEIYKTFAKFFREHKKASIRVLYRSELGPTTVIEHEEVSGVESTPIQSLVIYNLHGGLIQAVWFVPAE